jgi:cyanophycin synthetase
MIGHVMREEGHCVGMTTTDGIYIDEQCVVDGDTTGPRSAHTVLSDPAVDIAVLETARGGILRRGLGYDWSDVGVITNISEDHLGQDGIKSLDDIVFIKSLIAERVREGGTLVLNADDERVVSIADQRAVARTSKRIFYFSLRPDNPVVRNHLRRGGTAFLFQDGWLVEATHNETVRIAEAALLPVTMKGAAEFHIQNLLAAIAACRAQNVSLDLLGRSLQSFTGYKSNPGRVNLYKLNGGHVMVDYGHNSHAFEAICRMVKNWRDHRVTGVIAVPGDRDDDLIRRAGKVAARGFHRLFIREDYDRRGRVSGAVARLLCEAARDEAPGTECQIVLDEIQALHQAVKTMEKGEVIVVFYEKLEVLQRVLEQYRAQPVESLNGVNGHKKTGGVPLEGGAWAIAANLVT